MKLKKLTTQEKRVIEEGGTEAPFSGEYDNLFQDGFFACKRCGALLYRSEDKFDAHCGWPSFDDEIPGAVERNLDSDGRRTEISCTRCGAHLGHVFVGEKLTEKNTRHCVNSISMNFIPKSKIESTLETAYFGGGCFWCTQAVFDRLEGVLEATPGYAGGKLPKGEDRPTYESVSRGDSGFAEIVRVEFDRAKISFEMLLNVFFAIHDPTTLNRQGADIGTQYRSVIFYQDDLQKELAENFIQKLEKEHVFENPIVTEIKSLEKFHEAEDYHKNYFEKNPSASYCQAVISPKISKLRKKFSSLLKEK